MERQCVLNLLYSAGIVAVVRLRDRASLSNVIRALRDGGVTTIEVTMTTPDALQVIERLQQDDSLLIGVGSVLDAETAIAGMDAGARYVVSPVYSREIIEAAHSRDVAAIPGAFSPSEIHAASEAGADMVKVFPAGVGGPAYLEAVLAPMPRLRLMPTGGVTVENAGDWIRAGAFVVGVGSALLDDRAITDGRFDEIANRAARMTANINAARQSQRPGAKPARQAP